MRGASAARAGSQRSRSSSSRTPSSSSTRTISSPPEPAWLVSTTIASRMPGNGLQDVVELGRSHANPAAIQRRIRAAVHDGAPGRRDADPVAVAPDPRVAVEVGLPQPRSVGVVPEAERHRGQRCRHHELADLVDERAAFVVPGVGGHAEWPALDLPGPDGHCRASSRAAARRRPCRRSSTRRGGRSRPGRRASGTPRPGAESRWTQPYGGRRDRRSPSAPRRCGGRPRSRPRPPRSSSRRRGRQAATGRLHRGGAGARRRGRRLRR